VRQHDRFGDLRSGEFSSRIIKKGTKRKLTTSLILDSIGDVTILHLSCLVETTGSTAILIFGIAVNPNQILFEGGFLILTNRVPSNSCRTIAKTNLTEYGLNREEIDTVATVSIVILTAPTYET